MTSAILRGGTVIDGSGATRRPADVEIRGDRIERLVPPGTPSDAEAIDVRGLVVTPGFIDMHAHSDLAVLADRRHVAKLAQGVTLEVVGQDGLGYSPVTDQVMTAMRAQIAGWNGDPDLAYDWRSIGQYLAEVDRGVALNVAVLVPHGTVRMTVMGTSSRAASAGELARMREIISQGLDEGAMGLSAGLSYPPGMFASDDELVELLSAVRERGGYYNPHHRNYGTQAMESYLACIAVAERARVPLHLAHCHLNFPVNVGRAGELLSAIDLARDRGVDVSLDAYPYLASATYLASLLPGWAHEGGPDRTLALLVDPSSSEALRIAVEEVGSDGNHGVPADWSAISVSATVAPENAASVGRTIRELAEEGSVSTWDIVVRLLVSDELATGCLLAVGNESNMRVIMAHPAHTVGTDGILVGARPHPRGWGSFPRFLGEYSRDLGLLGLEDAVHHITGRPAERLGLRDRGVLRPGAFADLVVFDASTIASPADYTHPTLAPTGIDQVWVNGEVAMRGGVRTDALAGRAVRRG